MKKVLLCFTLFVVLFFKTPTFAQILKGNSFVGVSGSVGLRSNWYGDYRGPTLLKTTFDERLESLNLESLNFTAALSGGYYIKNRFAFGLSVGFIGFPFGAISVTDNRGVRIIDVNVSAHGLNAKVFGRYLLVNQPKFALFGDILADYYSVTTNDLYSLTQVYSIKQIGFGLNSGIIWFPNKSIGLEGSINLISITAFNTFKDNLGSRKGNTISLLGGTTSGIIFGANYYFGR